MKVNCIRDCFVDGWLFHRGRPYDIDPKVGHAKFFDFPDEPKSEKKPEPDAELKARAEELRKENESLKRFGPK
jgi:hypothetical protein